MKKSYIKMGVVLIGFVLSPIFVSAQMFPADAKTIGVRNETGTDNLNQIFLATSTPQHIRTILAVASQSKDARENTVYCGPATATGEVIFDTMASASNFQFQRFMAYKCDKAIYVDSMRTSFTGMTYLDYDMAVGATTTAQTVTVSNFPATQPVTISNWISSLAVTGTFWQATQPVSLASVPAHSVSVSNFPATQPVTGTFWQAVQPISGSFGTTTVAIATSTVTASVDLSSLPNFQEWLFVACVIIFLLGMIAWPRFTRVFKKKMDAI